MLGVRSDRVGLALPHGLSLGHRRTLLDVAARNEEEHGAGLLGLVLTGSAARGLATARSDVDLYVVLTDAAIGGRTTARSSEIDEIPVTLAELRAVPPFGTEGWWSRWSFAWTPTLLDRTEGEIPGLLRRLATLTPDEADAVLVDHDRLDGWLNYAYRALKSDRDGRALERRLDAAESMPWLLDVIFALAGRVRPYHKYLPWELREHPLPGWDAEQLLGLLTATLEGDPNAIRAAFERVEQRCWEFDAKRGEPRLRRVIEGWGDELDLLRR